MKQKIEVRIIRRLSNSGLLKWMPDSLYLKVIFKGVMGKKLNLAKPQTFNEKIQWLKINDRNPLYTELVDKYEVRNYISKWIGEEYLIPLVGGPWANVSCIDFGKLPDKFVLKCTHDSGGLVICRDKTNLDIENTKKTINESLRHNYYWHGREWPYKDVKPRIIAETFMSDDFEKEVEGLTDYKFFCFNGNPEIIYVSVGLENHSTASISFYNLEGSKMGFKRSDYPEIQTTLTLPDNFNEMIAIAKIIAEKVNCAFIRVDLYSIKGKTYFSEITFSPCSGMLPFSPESWDQKLGSMVSLNN